MVDRNYILRPILSSAAFCKVLQNINGIKVQFVSGRLNLIYSFSHLKKQYDFSYFTEPDSFLCLHKSHLLRYTILLHMVP